MKSHKTVSDGTESLPRGYGAQVHQDTVKEAVQWATAHRMRKSTQKGRQPGGGESRQGITAGCRLARGEQPHTG